MRKFKVGGRVVVNDRNKEQLCHIGKHGVIRYYDVGRPYPCTVELDNDRLGVFWPRELGKEEQDGKAE